MIFLSVTVVVVICVLYHLTCKISNVLKPITIDSVIARYNEDTDWLFMNEFKSVSKFIVYNKGIPIIKELPSNTTVINIPNVGKCDHTYLYHIVNNYNNLADVTFFISGSVNDPRKRSRIMNTMKIINNTRDSAFIIVRSKNPDDIYDFILDDYYSQNPENHVGSGKISRIEPAKIRPYGKWFNYHWPNQSTVGVPYTSIFAVHKRHILQHPIEYYIDFLEEVEVDINPEVGHYLERAWLMLFSPIPNKCIYNFYSPMQYFRNMI